MTRRRKKRVLALIGSLVFVIYTGTLLRIVYAQSFEQELQEKIAAQESVLSDLMGEPEQDTGEEQDVEEVQDTEEIYEENLPDDWNLILVNRTHPIPEDYEVELKSIGSGHQIDARAYDDFVAMIQAAKSEGVYIYVTS